MVTWEETVNWKVLEIVKSITERGVGQATPMVMSARRLSTVGVVTPGRLAFWALMLTRLSRLLLVSSRNSCPMFQFSSIITPVPLMWYASKDFDSAPTEGRLSDRMICKEWVVAAASAEGKFTTMVSVVSMFGLMAVTELLLTVRGLGLALDAVLRL